MPKQMETGKFQDYIDQINQEMAKGTAAANWTQPVDFYRKKKKAISQADIDMLVGFILPMLASSGSGKLPYDPKTTGSVDSANRIIQDSASGGNPLEQGMTVQQIIARQRALLGR